jgi:AmmeMemoRadiSam system protein B
VLCGSFSRSIQEGGLPEGDDEVRRFLDALGELAALRGSDWFFVLGIDLAHMGHRYGDSYPAEANRGPMEEVAARDRERLARVEAWDKAGFWRLVQQNQDDLKWCGAAPLYTLMSALPQARGRLLRYEQWNIDDQSVVSFAGMAFS